MKLYWFRILLSLYTNIAERHPAFGKEGVMAKIIEFHIPANFQPPKQRWTLEEMRGKIIDFQASTTRKSA